MGAMSIEEQRNSNSPRASLPGGTPQGSLPNGGTQPGVRPSDETSSESRLARRYRVIIHNDEQTPMDFVVRVLTGVYRLGVEHAIEVMLEAHGSDCAFVRAYGLEEAEFRVQRSHSLARSRSYPLTFTIESE